jgi:hypothetical protein
MTTRPTWRPLLDAAQCAFLRGPMAINVASRDDALVASIARAYGCKISKNRRRVHVFLATARSQAVLRDLRAGGPIAVVFCLPSTHKTVQVKAPCAQIVPVEPADRRILRAYRDAFFAEIHSLGYDERFSRALASGAIDEEAVAVTFEPVAAFEQTPGPEAGKQLAPTI